MFGSFMMNAYLMFSQAYPDSAQVVLNAMQQKIREDEIDLDLSSISKLFIIDDYNNVDLIQYGIFKSCFEYYLESAQEDINSNNDAVFEQKRGKFADRSPCLNITAYPECEVYCNWHKNLIYDKLSRHEIITLMGNHIMIYHVKQSTLVNM